MRPYRAETTYDGHAVDLLTRNLLLGGMPGSGKSFVLKLAAATTALTAEQVVPDLGSPSATPEAGVQ